MNICNLLKLKKKYKFLNFLKKRPSNSKLQKVEGEEKESFYDL